MRLLFWILLLSSIFTIIATIIQIYTDYRDSRQSLEVSLEQIQETVLPSVAVAMWKLDKEVMESILNGLLTQRDTIYVEVVDTYDNPVIQLGVINTENSFERLYPIMFFNDGVQAITIGELKVVVTLSEIYRQLTDKVLVILMTQAVKTFIMSVCILIIIDLLVIRHLHRIEEWAYQVEIDKPDQLLSLTRKHMQKNDVLDRVVNAINTMQSNLVKALTKRKQAERLVNSIIENSPSLIYSKNIDGHYTLVNHQFLTTFDFTHQQVIGHTDIELFPIAFSELLNKQDSMVKEKYQPISFEQKIDRKGQCEYYVVVKFPIFNDKGVLLETVGIYTNITDIKRKEQQIIELNQNLENKVSLRTKELEASLTNLKEAQSLLVESEKMSALGSLVAGVAHEINTPLGVTVTASSHLSEMISIFKNKYQNGNLKRSSLEELVNTVESGSMIIMKNLHRATELIQNFKQVAVDQSSEHKRQFELGSYLEELIYTLNPQLKSGQHAIVIEAETKIEMNSFPGALAQVMTNLIINSIKHGFKDIREGEINIKLALINETVQIDYKDNGVGLDASQKEKVFEPFYTTARFSGGSGLGMSISYNLVTAKLGGKIQCLESTTGAHFQLNIPFCFE